MTYVPSTTLPPCASGCGCATSTIAVCVPQLSIVLHPPSADVHEGPVSVAASLAVELSLVPTSFSSKIGGMSVWEHAHVMADPAAVIAISAHPRETPSMMAII